MNLINEMQFNRLTMDDMIVCTFRYSLGRATITAHAVIGFIIDNWTNFDDMHKRLFYKEIIDYKRINGNVGMFKEDESYWMEIVRLYENTR